MPTLMPHTVADIARLYQKNVMQPRKWTDLTRNFRNYYWADLTERRLKKVTRHSKTFTFTYMVGGYRNGVYDSYFQPDSLNRQNLSLTGEVNWSMYKTHWALDRREPNWPASGSSDVMIADHLKMQESNFWTGVFEDGEESLWTLVPYPNDGTAGEVQPWDIPYYVIQSATAAVGQNGGHPSGYSSVSGNSRTTYPQLKNYTGTYTDVSDGDLCDQLEDMLDLMGWKAPRPSAEEIDPGMDFEICSHRTPFKQYGSLLRTQNDNLGADNGKFRARPIGGSQMFMGVPWHWVDALSSALLRDGVTANPCYDSGQPIYMLNWSTWQMFAAEDFWMKVDPPLQLTDPHNTAAIWLNSISNLVCLDPGRNGVLKRV